MKYFIDTEFLEGTQTKRFLGIPYGNNKPTIDLISIGIVSEDGREYYAISKDFNLEEAWNRFDLIKKKRFQTDYSEYTEKIYWIRNNVLKPIWKDLVKEHNQKVSRLGLSISHKDENKFNFKSFKELLNAYGKTNKQIAQEVKEFCKPDRQYEIVQPITIKYSEIQNPKFYGYYSDYDWVAFCWLFGKMIDLPKGFPMYCRDLKQTLDEKVRNLGNCITEESFNKHLEYCKNLPNYPKQTNEHNALSDAHWNKQLYEFLQKI